MSDDEIYYVFDTYRGNTSPAMTKAAAEAIAEKAAVPGSGKEVVVLKKVASVVHPVTRPGWTYFA